MSSFTLASSAFNAGGTIPARFTCDGSDQSPELHWSEVPARTASFALTVVDPDAPGGEFTHWVLFDISGDRQELPEHAGAGTGGIPGKNDFGKVGYGGPCPPHGRGAHRYVFTLYALDIDRLGLARGARRDEVERAMHGHLLGRAQLTGTYGRP